MTIVKRPSSKVGVWTKASNELALALLLDGRAAAAETVLRESLANLDRWSELSPNAAVASFDCWINLAELRQRTGRDCDSRMLWDCYKFAAGHSLSLDRVPSAVIRAGRASDQTQLIRGLAVLEYRSLTALLKQLVDEERDRALEFARVILADHSETTSAACVLPLEIVAFAGDDGDVQEFIAARRNEDYASEAMIVADIQLGLRYGDVSLVADWGLRLSAYERANTFAWRIIPMWEVVLYALKGDTETAALRVSAMTEIARTSQDRSLYARVNSLARIIGIGDSITLEFPPQPIHVFEIETIAAEFLLSASAVCQP